MFLLCHIPQDTTKENVYIRQNLSLMRLTATIVTSIIYLSVFGAQDSTVSLQDTLYKPWKATHILEVNNNGISIVPAFSLGRPAMMYLGRIGNERFQFEPEVRMSYDAEPWSMIFWARYKAPQIGKWSFTAATQYALLYAPVENDINGTIVRSFMSNRYTAVQGTAYRPLKNNFGFSAYSLAAVGMDKGASLSPVVLTGVVLIAPNFNLGPIALNLRPQLYHLNMRGPQGIFYAVNYKLPINKEWSITGIITQPIIKDEELTVAPFIWNIGLNYTLNHTHNRVVVPQL